MQGLRDADAATCVPTPKCWCIRTSRPTDFARCASLRRFYAKTHRWVRSHQQLQDCQHALRECLLKEDDDQTKRLRNPNDGYVRRKDALKVNRALLRNYWYGNLDKEIHDAALH